MNLMANMSTFFFFFAQQKLQHRKDTSTEQNVYDVECHNIKYTDNHFVPSCNKAT